MPTIHVEPGSESLLQEIATALWKSRKVVVITGAGISTNSGIPDFRSENGLYSLIQAQFDAAAKESSSDNGDADESDRSADFALERPAKRRRVSREGLDGASSDASEEQQQGDRRFQEGHDVDNNVKAERSERATSPRQISADVPVSRSSPPFGHERLDSKTTEDNVVMEDAIEEEHAPGRPDACQSDGGAGPSGDNKPTVPHNVLTPVSSPRLSGRGPEPHQPDTRISTPEKRPMPFASSPPSLDLGPGHVPVVSSLGSSPLSSPPPILLDPYQDYQSQSSSPSPGSSTQDSMSSRSESEEPSSASTPLLTSQTSFASSSSRTSLPVLKGKDLFDAQIWSCPVKTSVFYTFATSLRHKVRQAEPTDSHHFVSVLRDSRKLVRCYTQNIDQLEERVGLSTSLELGAGNRYRFSARAGRGAAGTKGTTKDAEATAPAPSQATSEPDEASSQSQVEPPNTQDDSQPESQTALVSVDQKEAEAPKESGGHPVTGDNSGSIPVDAATATAAPTAPPSSQGSQGPNRGVECVFLHGSLAELRCFQCGRTSPWDEETRLADTLAGRQPACPHCAGATAARQERGKRALGVGKLRPDIVLYGEEHPHSHLISPIIQHDLSLGPDMLLILGTSMRVHGLKVLVKEFAKAVHDRGGKVVFVNFTKPPESVWADVLDFWIQWDCDAWVGDLRQRKPALWLPPGTTLPEEEKTKPSRPRKSGGGDAVKRRESAKASAAKRRESNGPAKIPEEAKESICVGGSSDPIDRHADLQQDTQQDKPQDTQRDMQQATQQDTQKATQETLPPVPRALRTVKARVERKLNPNAKRPASVRDHKQNAAYLSWKIMEDLRRITGSPSTASVASSPLPAQPKPKKSRPRKSAPAALGTQDGPLGEDQKQPSSEIGEVTPNPEEAVSESMTLPGLRPSLTHSEMEDSQPTGSKTDQGDSPSMDSPSVKPQTEQRDSISAAVKSRKRKRLTWKKINGVETPVTVDESSRQPPAAANAPSAGAPAPLPGPEAVLSLDLLPPVRLPKIKTQGKAAKRSKKLQPLEPQATSPGPRAMPLPSNVGSPPAYRRPNPWGIHNPFILTDPLERYFGFPLSWYQPRPAREAHGGWNPEEQLRRDQEAALMLSEMRSRG
ncbi:hypothetical protein B0T16DRAFT_461963 [Cercophora newfieldiana]|uniref:Deacetylase sirtuin-type domain-containing protein n=1 Tax=Cercophora newfieldiana TaxID=92897 RepID=A0AA39XX91_9PEZI|nr:hypothetical protein B0T16DRAFT_461963 [Cercophora newfieldiana]